MKEKNKKTKRQEIIDDLDGFARITYLFLDETHAEVFGYEDLKGAHLITNAAYQEYYGTEMGQTDAGCAELPDLVEFENGIQELKTHDFEFVVCYHHDQSPAWCLDCSPGMTRMEALNRLIYFLQGGLCMDELE